MIWLVYGICGILILLAIWIFVKEIRKMIKGRCCEDCKHCAVKDNCSANEIDKKKENK